MSVYGMVTFKEFIFAYLIAVPVVVTLLVIRMALISDGIFTVDMTSHGEYEAEVSIFVVWLLFATRYLRHFIFIYLIVVPVVVTLLIMKMVFVSDGMFTIDMTSRGEYRIYMSMFAVWLLLAIIYSRQFIVAFYSKIT